jgi:hypothetical protein
VVAALGSGARWRSGGGTRRRGGGVGRRGGAGGEAATARGRRTGKEKIEPSRLYKD